MPTYEFYNTETKEIEEHLMSYKDLDKFAEDNPHLKKRISATATISQESPQHSTKQVFD